MHSWLKTPIFSFLLKNQSKTCFWSAFTHCKVKNDFRYKGTLWLLNPLAWNGLWQSFAICFPSLRGVRVGRKGCALRRLQVLMLSHFSFNKIKLLGSFFFFFLENLLCFAMISAMRSMSHSDIRSSDGWFYLQLLQKLNPIINKPQSVLVTTSVALTGTATPCQMSTDTTTGPAAQKSLPPLLPPKIWQSQVFQCSSHELCQVLGSAVSASCSQWHLECAEYTSNELDDANCESIFYLY